MPLPRDDPLERPERRREQFPSLGIRPEKLVEGNLLTLSDITPARIGAALTNHGHLRHNLSAITDPGVTDDEDSGYSTGSVWVNISSPKIFVCVTAAEGAADWNQTDAIAAAADHDHTGGGDGGVLTKPELDDYMILGEISAPGGDPAANKGWLYVKDDGGTSGLYFEADDGTVTDLLAAGGGGGNTLDAAYDQGGAGSGRTITADNGTVKVTDDGLEATKLLINDVDGTPVGDILLTVINEILRVRNSADSAYKNVELAELILGAPTNNGILLKAVAGILFVQKGDDSALATINANAIGANSIDTQSGNDRLSMGGRANLRRLYIPISEGDPGTVGNGDIWYDVIANKFRAREAGASTDIIHAEYLDSDAVAAVQTDGATKQETYIPFGNEPEAGVTIFPT